MWLLENQLTHSEEKFAAVVGSRGRASEASRPGSAIF